MIITDFWGQDIILQLKVVNNIMGFINQRRLLHFIYDRSRGHPKNFHLVVFHEVVFLLSLFSTSRIQEAYRAFIVHKQCCFLYVFCIIRRLVLYEGLVRVIIHYLPLFWGRRLKGLRTRWRSKIVYRRKTRSKRLVWETSIIIPRKMRRSNV